MSLRTIPQGMEASSFDSLTEGRQSTIYPVLRPDHQSRLQVEGRLQARSPCSVPRPFRRHLRSDEC